jgi:hypothetical protein
MDLLGQDLATGNKQKLAVGPCKGKDVKKNAEAWDFLSDIEDLSGLEEPSTPNPPAAPPTFDHSYYCI